MGVEEVDAGWIVLPFHSPVVHIVTDPLAALLHAPPLFRAQDVRGLPRFAEALAAPQSMGALSVRGRSSSMHLAALFWLEWHAQVGAALEVAQVHRARARVVHRHPVLHPAAAIEGVWMTKTHPKSITTCHLKDFGWISGQML